MNKIQTIFVFLFTFIFLSGCDDDAEKGWSELAKKCAVNDLTPESIMYFGPSHNVGPGSVWRKAKNNSYRLRWSEQAMPSTNINFIQHGEQFDCEGVNSTKFGANTSLGFSSSLSSTSGDFSADFQKASDIQIKASKMQWDLVIEGTYEQYVKSLPPIDGSFRKDLEKGDRLIIYRALKVIGYEAKLTFDSKTGSSIKGKYLNEITSTKFSPALNLTWSGNTELKITSKKDFYIAGELVPYSPTGFSSASTTVLGKPVNIGKNYQVEVEK